MEREVSLSLFPRFEVGFQIVYDSEQETIELSCQQKADTKARKGPREQRSLPRNNKALVVEL